MSKNPPADQESRVDLRNVRSSRTRQRILEAATELCLDDGWSSTSIDKIAAKADVTRPTIYSHFESKEGLFQVVMQAFASNPVQQLAGLLEPSGDLRSDLIKFGNFIIAQGFESNALQLGRLATTESNAHPEIGVAFFEAGPAQVLRQLSKYFEAQTKAGRLHVSNFASSAELFLSMILGLDLLRAQVGLPLHSTAIQKRRCRVAVDLFLSSYGAE